MFSSQIQINLDAIRHNVRLIKQFVGPKVAVLAAVKANEGTAYRYPITLRLVK